MRGPRGPTVTGTANVLSAAVLAKGTTTITGAAVEPEIVDLGNFLNALGAKIDGLGTPTIRVTGVDQLHGGAYRVIPDRIEAATLLLAVAITGGSATVCGVVPDHLAAVLACLRAAGCRLDVGQVANLPHDIAITADGPPQPLEVIAEPYPGVPTDVQAQLTALLCSGARDKPRARRRLPRPLPARGRTAAIGRAASSAATARPRLPASNGSPAPRSRPPISAPAPPWCLPVWPPKAPPASTAPNTSTAATNGSTTNSANSARIERLGGVDEELLCC